MLWLGYPLRSCVADPFLSLRFLHNDRKGSVREITYFTYYYYFFLILIAEPVEATTYRAPLATINDLILNDLILNGGLSKK